MPFAKGIGGPELIIILIVVLIIFGPKQLPKLGKMFGKTVKEVRTGMEEAQKEMDGTDSGAAKSETDEDTSDKA